MDAHKVAHGALRGACAEGDPTVGVQAEAMLLMVENRYTGSETVLRSLDELQPGGTVKHNIPFRWSCVYTLFQGEPAKLCLCSNPLFPNILKLERFPWWSIVITEVMRLLS